MERRAAEPKVAADLAPRWAGLMGLAALRVTDAAGARAAAGPGPVNTDDHCTIEYTSARAIYRDTTAEVLGFVEGMRTRGGDADGYADLPPAAREELERRREARRLLSHVTRLRAERDLEGMADALKALSEALVPEPDLELSFNGLAVELGREGVREFGAGRREKGMSLLARTPGNSSAYVPSRVMLADLYRRENRRDDARRSYREALEAQPKFFAAAAGLAAMTEEAGAIAEAIPLWEQAVRLQPRSVPARVRLASCLQKAGRTEELRLQCLEILKLDPHNAEASLLLGRGGSR